MMPHVSVILPYYNGGQRLLKSIESVRTQRGVSWELVIVDDGSSQSPLSIVQSFADERIRLFHIPHSGKGAALNKGVQEARSDFFCFIDQDDIMNPGRLQLQYEVLAEQEEVDVVYSDYERVDDDESNIDIMKSRQATNRECLHEMAIGKGLIAMQTIMIRKKACQAIGGFSPDSRLTGLDDAEFMARLFVSSLTLRYVQGVVQKWVSHENNYMKSEPFQEARLVLLDYFHQLADRYPMAQKELPIFQYHTFIMRGLYYMERDHPEKAIPELVRAIQCHPFQLNAYYLLAKSHVKTIFGHRP